MRMAVLIEPSPSPPFKAEREGPAKREGEVGGAANRINRPLHPALPPAATGRRGERVIRSDDWHIFSASAVMTAGVGFAVLARFDNPDIVLRTGPAHSSGGARRGPPRICGFRHDPS